MKKKGIALLMAATLCVGSVIGGTVAWLTTKSETVTNTFTVGDINITLKEHDYIPTTGTLDQNMTVQTNDDYAFVPGDTLPKDPFVTVMANSEACYLFVKATETNNTVTGLDGDVINWSVDTTVWTPLTNSEDNTVWYLEVSAEDAKNGKDYNVLANKQVTVNTAVTKKMADDVLDTNKPVLTFEAYAIQKDNLTTTDMSEIWALANPTS